SLGAGLGLNSSFPVSALAVSGNTVYAGGLFTNSGSAIITNVAQWNGTYWTNMNSGLGTSRNNSIWVSALVLSGGTLYAGGALTNAGGVFITNIAQWNGINWSPVGAGVSQGVNQFSTVTALASSGPNVYAGGIFNTAGGLPANDIAQWNGSSWSSVGK